MSIGLLASNYFLILSPPTILLAELGNFDILIVFLVLLAGISLSKNLYIMALTMVAVATLMKFYTIPLLFVLIFFSKNRFQRLTTIVVGILVGIRVLADLQLIKSDFPSGFYEQFGASVWPKYLENSHFNGFGGPINFVIGIAIFSVLYIWVLKFLKNNFLSLDEKYTGSYRERILFYFLFGTHLTCYLAGVNFDHRLIFFSLSSLIFLNYFSDYGSKFSNLLTLLVIVAVWITFPAQGLEPIGDLALEIASILMSIKMVSLLKIDLGHVMDWKIWKI